MEILYENSDNKLLLNTLELNRGDGFFHWHKKVEIVQCLNCSFEALIDGKKYIVEKGDILVIGEGTVHNFTSIEDNTKIRLLQFPFSILLNYGVVPPKIKTVIKADEIKKIENLKEKTDAFFDMLKTEEWVKDGEQNIFLECTYSAIYYLLAKYFPVEESTQSAKKEKEDFYKAVEYVNEHFCQDITLQSIANILYTDRGRLSKLFLKYAGMSINDYINSLRLNKALKLIDSGVKVADAALESGFQSVRTYNNILKKRNV